MSKKINLLGKRFGRLIVISEAPSVNGRTCWHCKCDCGKEITTKKDNLLQGKTRSCGCLYLESASKLHKSHGMSNTRLFYIWQSMRHRCTIKNDRAYKNYGGRGIKVCEEWTSDFMNFYNWAINNGYRDDLTIDRINVNGNYEPSNCRWIPKEYQAENKRNSRYVYFNGEKFTIPQFANILGITFELLIYRLKKNNYNLSSLFTYITDQYGNTKSYILDKYNNPIPINGIYFIDEYGFPINMNNYNKDE